MALGFAMLVHEDLNRAAQVARHLAAADCPVVIHVDRKVPAADLAGLRDALRAHPAVSFCERHRCEWGGWGLVRATQEAYETLLRHQPDVRHVMLISGSCLPLRPIAELRAYLAARPDVDFIESVATADVGWATGGLDLERFTLRFPFCWRRRRRLFDAWVDLQRRLRLSRAIPEGLSPHLGSQWWCLTRRTLEAILTDPRRAEFDAYFRGVWIPDEAYFQTLVRRHSDAIEGRSLTLAKFDRHGRPHLFYDDHLQLLRRSDGFVARKIWRGADRLYGAFLGPAAARAPAREPNPAKIDRVFAQAAERRTRGRTGLVMQSRVPRDGWEAGRTAAPYIVLMGFDAVFRGFDQWIAEALPGARVHGRLFHPEGARFAGGGETFAGGLSGSAALRDVDPRGFLRSLIWNARGERQVFAWHPGDRGELAHGLAGDPNASVRVISGAWTIDLMRTGQPVAALRERAATWHRTQTAHLSALRSTHARADVRVVDLAEIVAKPAERLAEMMEGLREARPVTPTEAPRLSDLSELPRFLQALRSAGLNPKLAGDVSLAPPPAPELPARRLYAVRG